MDTSEIYKMLKELEVSKIMFYVCYKRKLLVVFLILRYTMRMANTRQTIFVSSCVPTPCSVSLKLAFVGEGLMTQLVRVISSPGSHLLI